MNLEAQNSARYVFFFGNDNDNSLGYIFLLSDKCNNYIDHSFSCMMFVVNGYNLDSKHVIRTQRINIYIV